MLNQGWESGLKIKAADERTDGEEKKTTIEQEERGTAEELLRRRGKKFEGRKEGQRALEMD